MPINRLNVQALRSLANAPVGQAFVPDPFGLVPGVLDIVQAPGGIGFRLDGKLRWTVETRWFAGTPTLTVHMKPHAESRIELENARFPGTDLPADFILILQPTGLFGTPAAIQFKLGGFQGHMTLERWLAGQAVLQSPVTLGQDVCPLGASSKLAVDGAAQARFYANWQFQMSGSKMASISGLADAVDSDRFTLKLLLPGDPSIARQPSQRRSRIDLAANGPTWQVIPASTAIPIGELVAAMPLFNAIAIETGESANGNTQRALRATSSHNEGLVLKLAGGITDLDGAPASLPLSEPGYSISFDPTPDHSAGDDTLLIARFGARPQWLALDGFALGVGESSPGPAFEVETFNGEVGEVVCQPTLFLASAPLAVPDDTLLAVNPAPPAVPTYLPFVAAPGAQPGWGVLAAPAVAGKPRLSLPDFSVNVLRRDDLLSLTFLFHHAALEGGGRTPALVPMDAAQKAYFVVRFDAPQNLGEQAFLEASFARADKSTPLEPIVTPAKVVAAGPSRLAFEFPPLAASIPWSFESLISWTGLTPSLVPVALPANTDVGGPMPPPPPGVFRLFPSIREPLDTETAIEAPWHLFLSTLPDAAWKHSIAPVTLNERTELWHTRLATATANQGIDESLTRHVRAVWHTGYTGTLPGHADVPFRMSLDPNDRDQIVRLSSTFNRVYRAPAIQADKLYLSSLGAWMDMLGTFEPETYVGEQLSVGQWRHKAAMGRDNYVRVEYEGYLLPFGNKAVLVKVTERKFAPNADGNTAAVLRQRFFIKVKQPLVTYDDDAINNAQRRGKPHRSILITTLVTPDLTQPLLDAGKYSFFPQVPPGVNFPFHIVGEDAEQQYAQSSDFSAALYFVEDGAPLQHALNNYNANDAARTIQLAGQKLAFAPSGKPGDTTLHTSSIKLTAAQVLSNRPPLLPPPRFFPQLESAKVSVPAIQQVTGKPLDTQVAYFADYLSQETLNDGEVFLRTQAPVPVQFSGDQSGGVATPNMNVSGLSRKFGTVSGSNPSQIANGKFDPKDFFGDPDARLFGVVPLTDLVKDVFGDLTVPKLTTNRFADHIETNLDWQPQVVNYSLGPITLDFDDPANALALKVQIVTPLKGGSPQATIDGSLVSFSLGLASVIGVKFNSIKFSAPAGRKLNFSADVDNKGLVFLGDLSFLNQLQNYIPTDGFTDPPSVDVSADGVTVGYTLAIPSVGVGVFSLENISLSAGLTLPFMPPSPLRLRFAFSEREHPFLITVSLLGGGGFFGISLGPDGVEMLEASLEFGANASIDVVVASGNVHIMAGVYLKIDETGNDASLLTGYLRAGGSLDVLGLISASIEFYLGFLYYFEPECKIAGEASVTIEVHVLLFSGSVSAKLRREFEDPQASFADLIAQDDWNYYCDSFAA